MSFPSTAAATTGAPREDGREVPSSHAAFVARITSTKNKDGVRRLALKWVAKHLDRTSTEASFVTAVEAREEAETWKRVVARMPLAANTRDDVILANRLATKFLSDFLLARVTRHRSMRLYAHTLMPKSETKQEEELRSGAVKAAKQRRKNRPKRRSLPLARLPTRMSPQENEAEWSARLRDAVSASVAPKH